MDVNRLATGTTTRERISIVTQTERFLRCMSLLSNFIGIRSARKNIGEGNKHIPLVVNWYLNTVLQRRECGKPVVTSPYSPEHSPYDDSL